MRNFQVAMVLFFLSGFSQIAFAEDYVIGVCKLQSHSDKQTAFLAPCEPWASKNSCTKGNWIAWKMDEFQGKTMYTTALTAFASGHKVQVRMDGSTCEIGSGTATYDVTTMVRIIK